MAKRKKSQKLVIENENKMFKDYEYTRLLEKPKNVVDNMIEFLSLAHPRWKKKLQPASEEQIRKLIDASKIEESGYQLPETFLDYLRKMGKDNGGLFETDYLGISDIDYLTNLYLTWWKEPDDDGSMEVPDNRFSFLANYDDEPVYHFIFQDPTKYYVKTYWQRSEDFDKCLYQIAFQYFLYRIPLKRWIFAMFTNEENKYLKENAVEKIEELGQKYGYQKAWFSDKWNYHGIKSGSVIQVIHETYYIWSVGYINQIIIRAMGTKVEEVNEIQKELEKMDLRINKVLRDNICR